MSTTLTYASGDEIRAGDLIVYLGVAVGWVDFVAVEGEPETSWYFEEYGASMMLVVEGMGSLYITHRHAVEPECGCDPLRLVERPRSDPGLLTAYLRHAEAVADGRPDDAGHRAWEAVEELRRRDPESLWIFVCDAVRRTIDDRTRAYIAAGPLEGLLIDAGERFIHRIESEAGRDARMKRALRGVWGHDRMPPMVAERLRCLVADEPPL